MIRKYGYRLIGIVMCAVLLMSGIFTYDYAREGRKGKRVQAAKTEVDYSQYTESNPLTVIEIVPYIMYAEFGYHIAGGGIADFEAMEDDSERAHKGEQTLTGEAPMYKIQSFCAMKYEMFQVRNESSKMVAIYSTEYFKRYSLEIGKNKVTDELLKKQAIRKRLQREIDTTNDATHKANCEQTLNEYPMTEQEQDILDKFNSVKVVYQAVLASEVNANPSMLDNADIIFITSVCASSNGDGGKEAAQYIRAYLKEEYAKKLRGCPDVRDVSMTDYEKKIKADPFCYDDQCLSWEAANHIFLLSSVPGGTPVVMNKLTEQTGKKTDSEEVNGHGKSEWKNVEIRYTELNENNQRVLAKTKMEKPIDVHGTSNNMSKLYLMLFQKDPYVFRNDYYRYVDKNNGNFTLQEGDAQKYWNVQTFMDYIEGVNEPFKYPPNAGQNYGQFNNILLTNGFTWNSNNSFYTHFISQEAWAGVNISDKSNSTEDCYYSGGTKFSKDVIEEFPNQNTITVAEAIGFLLSKKNHTSQTINKKSLKVLELEPSNDFTISESKVKEYLSDYKGEVDITYMTSAQFNSTETNLAKTYDLIIMGQNTGALSEKGGNDLIYWKTGKDVTAKVDDKHVNTNYPGNDITQDKKNQIIAYLDSGRPILMADGLYDLPSTTEGRIQNGSNMRALLTDAKVSQAKTKNQIVKLSVAELTPYVATNSLRSYLEVFRPTATNINVSYTSDTIRATFDISNMEEAGENVTVKATLFAYLQGKNPTAGCWVGAVDINKNGSYTLNARGDIARELETADPSIKYYLVLEQNGNNKISTEYSGMATRTDNTPNTIKVLQIAPTNTTVDLTSTSDEVGASIHSLTKETIHVTKITVKDFENKYTAMPYNSKDITTNQLLGYDVIVFGCSDDYPQISNKNGALSNVIAQMEKKQSVIFTNGVLHPKQTYTDAETTNAYKRLRQLAAMQESDYTYPYLNKNKTAGTQSTMYACENDKTNQVAERATAVNIGMVSEYPYKIETTELKQKTIHSKLQNSQQETVHENSFRSIALANGKGQIHQANLSHVKGYYALTNDDEAGRKQFSVSPNDIQNNYYLYQTGSVWYSGIGANKLSSSNQQEANLFVNTIIAAYYSAPKAPEVFFEDTNKNEDGTDSVFVDADVFSKEVGADKVITFRPYDAQGTPMDTTIYIDRNGTLEKITKVTDKNGNKIETENRRLNSNEHYKVTISSNVLSDPNVKIYIYVSNENGTGMGECHIVRRVEFDLD